MKLYLNILLTWISLARSHTHDEISKCTLTGVHKTRQTILESPNYPNNYNPDTCWDYVIRSPYRCPTKFHIQFLDFYLEASKDCENDYLAIGLDNVDDDMDTLCGQVVGIKKYHTPDGVLRLRFYADGSPWSTGKGFKLLITRLACEKEEVLRELEEDDDTITLTAPAGHFELPHIQIMQIFRNLSGAEQHQVYPLPPVFGLNYPTQLPSPPHPGYGGLYLPSQTVAPQSNYIGSLPNTLEQPCRDKGQQQPQQQQQQQLPYVPTDVTNANNYLPTTGDQYIGTWSSAPNPIRARDDTASSVAACCTSGFQQKRFYLSSPGFPRTIFSNLLPSEHRDCEFHLQKHKANVCRLRVDFKFFDFGQSFQGTGSYQGNIGLPAIESSKNTCTDDYIEIDNQRFCGCRSDNVFNAFWNYQGDKKIRMRMGYSGIPSGGFLLELTQEECSETQFSSTNFGPDALPLPGTTDNPNRFLNNNLENHHLSQGYLPPQPGFPQQSGLSHQSGFLQQIGPLQQQYPGQQQHFPQQPQYLAQQPFFNSQGFSSGLQQNPLQHNLQIPHNNYQPLSQITASYPGYQQQSLGTQHPLQSNRYGLQQLRYARSYIDSSYSSQPVSVVETNSTRKEYYYSDSDGNNPNRAVAMSRSSRVEGISRWEDEDIKATPKAAALRQKCSFDMRDILRLSVDVLWLTKPTCYAPLRNWFANWLG